MKILVIDGQGGKMGAALTDQIKKNMPDTEVVALSLIHISEPTRRS